MSDDVCPNCQESLSQELWRLKPGESECWEAHEWQYGLFSRELFCPRCDSRIRAEWQVCVSIECDLDSLEALDMHPSKEKLAKYFAVSPEEYIFERNRPCRHCGLGQLVKGRSAKALMDEGFRILQAFPFHELTCPSCSGLSEK